MPIADSVKLGKDVKIFHPSLVNLYGCTIGDDTKIGAFVEIQKNAIIGARCKISSHTFICEGVTDRGRGVHRPRRDVHQRSSTRAPPIRTARLQTEADWKVESRRVIRRAASIGSNATIVSGVTIGVGRAGRRRRGRDARRARLRHRRRRAGRVIGDTRKTK